MKLKILAFAVGLTLTTHFICRADPLDTWSWRNPTPVGNTLNDTVYGNGLFVAVGGCGSIINSRDGSNWSQCYSGASESFLGITYASGLFVAIGGNYGAIFTSSDGTNWSQCLGTTAGLSSITSGDGLFVAAGSSGTILVSLDGITWTQHNAGVNATLSSIVYGNGLFATAGYGLLLTSPDGINWTQRSITTTPYEINRIVYADGIFVGVGESENNSWSGTIFTSTNGLNWSLQVFNTGYFYGVTYGRGTFVVVGQSGVTLTSSNGISWVQHSAGAFNGLNAVAYGDNLFVAVGSDNLSYPQTLGPYVGAIVTSPDGSSWTQRNFGTAANFRGIGFSNNQFMALGSLTLTSQHGDTWITGLMPIYPYDYFYDMTYGDGLHVVVRNNSESGSNTILTSSDGTNWNACILNGLVEDVAFGNGQFVAVGPSGYVFSSTDGTNWFQSFAPAWLCSITYAQDQFFAVGATNDGYGDYYGTILTSSSGSNWTRVNLGMSVGTLNSIVCSSGYFVAVGEYGAIITSSDGTNWIRRNSGTSQSLTGIAYGNNHFVAVGDTGTILQSGEMAPSPNIITQPQSQMAQVGTNVSFAVSAVGASALTYQWQFKGQNSAGQTAARLSLTNVQFANAGGYSVIVSNAYGSATSAVAQLTVFTDLVVAQTTRTPQTTEIGSPTIPTDPNHFQSSAKSMGRFGLRESS